MNPSAARLEARGIRKRYGSVTALDAVGLELRAGEIHALVGENGAGKSTLLKILSGAVRPDGGTLALDGRELPPGDVFERYGDVRCVPQELELFPSLSVRENCFSVERLPRRAGWIDWRATRRRANELLSRFKHDLPGRRPLKALTPPERALVQLSAFLDGEPRVLALDEPTASLGDAEARTLFATLRALRSHGCAILYVSHRLGEVLELADRVTVLRNGRRVWTREVRRGDGDEGEPKSLDEEAIVEAMVGESISVYFPELPATGGDTRFELRGARDAGSAFEDVSLALRAGEILGIYGVAGSGRTELVRALVGQRDWRGALLVDQVERAPFRSPREAYRAGLAYVPGDRLTEGNLRGRSVRENLTISSLERFGGAAWIDRPSESAHAAALRARFSIVTSSLEAEIDTLSGGNQQKTIMGRALSTQPAILVLDEPTRGVDVGARAEIHRWIAELAASGQAVVYAGTDLPELLGMCHRIVVLREGHVAGVFDRDGASEEAITLAALPSGRGLREDGSPEPDRAAAPGSASRIARRPPLLQSITDWYSREAILIAACALLAIFTAVSFPGSLSGDFWVALGATTAPLAIAACGMTLVIASGAIDLSVGSTLALGAAAWALWIGNDGSSSVIVGLLLASAIGAGVGLLNGFLTVVARVPPIVATLGTMGILSGVFKLWTGGKWLQIPEPVRLLARSGPLGIPVTVWVAALFVAGAAALAHWRIEFREVLALGDNAAAAERHGIRRARARVVAFAFLGVCTGLAAALYTTRFGSVQNNTGEGFELQVIAAAVIGGANLAGGRGTILGAVLGALFLGLIAEVRSIWGVHERWQLMAIGVLMIAVIALERAFRSTSREDRR